MTKIMIDAKDYCIICIELIKSYMKWLELNLSANYTRVRDL